MRNPEKGLINCFSRNYLAVVTSQYFLFKNLIKGYHKSLVFLRI